jgi:hypothetical protein
MAQVDHRLTKVMMFDQIIRVNDPDENLGCHSLMSCNQQGSVQTWRSVDSGWWLLFDRGRSDLMARFNGAAGRRRG